MNTPIETSPLVDEEYRKLIEDGRIEFITFHPSYSYEEFIEGLTVQVTADNKPSDSLQYILKDGLFKLLCTRALVGAMGESCHLDPSSTSWREAYNKYLEIEPLEWDDVPKFVLIIDEINRGDISKILGELVTLLEADKRLGAENELKARLPLSQCDFSVPQNVYIIATMNTADRSIALLDIALRRRFGFMQMEPNLDLVLDDSKNRNLNGMDDETRTLLKKSVNAIERLNKAISGDIALGRDKVIGHSFLFQVKDKKDVIFVWKHEIIPLLDEYCYGDETKENRLLFNDGDHCMISIDNIDEYLDEIINARN